MSVQFCKSLAAAALLMACLFAWNTAHAQVQGEAPYQSAMKDACNAELDRDATWRAEIRDDVRAAVHEEETASLLKNKQHVVAAYVVIWAAMIIFMVLMFNRQQNLKKELARIEEEMRRAAAA